MEGSFQ